MAQNDRFLGGAAPRAIARTLMDATSLRAVVSEQDRAFLSQNEKIKLQNSAEKGLEIKYDLLDNINLTDIETLKAVYQMSIRTEELKDDMARYDIQSVMLIPSTFTEDANGEFHPAPGARPIDLFTSAADIKLEVVKQASEWQMRFGQDYHVENLFWTGAKILNSCSPRLREKLEDSVNEFRLVHRTGPVYLVMLYHLVLSSTPVSMRAVTRRLEKLTLGDFDGENVKNSISLIRGAIGLLDNNNALPPDIVDIIFRIMKTSSTTEFNTHVNLMRSNNE